MCRGARGSQGHRPRSPGDNSGGRRPPPRLFRLSLAPAMQPRAYVVPGRCSHRPGCSCRSGSARARRVRAAPTAARNGTGLARDCTEGFASLAPLLNTSHVGTACGRANGPARPSLYTGPRGGGRTAADNSPTGTAHIVRPGLPRPPVRRRSGRLGLCTIHTAVWSPDGGDEARATGDLYGLREPRQRKQSGHAAQRTRRSAYGPHHLPQIPCRERVKGRLRR